MPIRMNNLRPATQNQLGNVQGTVSGIVGQQYPPQQPPLPGEMRFNPQTGRYEPIAPANNPPGGIPPGPQPASPFGPLPASNVPGMLGIGPGSTLLPNSPAPGLSGSVTGSMAAAAAQGTGGQVPTMAQFYQNLNSGRTPDQERVYQQVQNLAPFWAGGPMGQNQAMSTTAAAGAYNQFLQGLTGAYNADTSRLQQTGIPGSVPGSLATNAANAQAGIDQNAIARENIQAQNQRAAAENRARLIGGFAGAGYDPQSAAAAASTAGFGPPGPSAQSPFQPLNGPGGSPPAGQPQGMTQPAMIRNPQTQQMEPNPLAGMTAPPGMNLTQQFAPLMGQPNPGEAWRWMDQNLPRMNSTPEGRAFLQQNWPRIRDLITRHISPADLNAYTYRSDEDRAALGSVANPNAFQYLGMPIRQLGSNIGTIFGMAPEAGQNSIGIIRQLDQLTNRIPPEWANRLPQGPAPAIR